MGCSRQANTCHSKSCLISRTWWLDIDPRRLPDELLLTQTRSIGTIQTEALTILISSRRPISL
jgi:hypothetical protein